MIKGQFVGNTFFCLCGSICPTSNMPPNDNEPPYILTCYDCGAIYETTCNRSGLISIKIINASSEPQHQIALDAPHAPQGEVFTEEDVPIHDDPKSSMFSKINIILDLIIKLLSK